MAARTQSEIEALAADIRDSRGEALAIPCDVTQEEQVKAMIGACLEHFGRVDILVNNAGTGTFRPVWGTHLPNWERMLAINLTSTYLCTKYVWKPMREKGGGCIINISSTSGTRAYVNYSAYGASKWGQIGYTKNAAEEGKADNIRVNAIAPGKVDTPMREKISEDKTRMLKAEDCVGTAIYLASDDARYVTGQVIEIEWFEMNA